MPISAATPATTRRRCRGGGIRLHGAVGQPAGVPHQVDGGEVGDDDDGQDAAQDRRGVHPAGPGITGLAPAGTRPEAMAPAMAPMQ